MSDAIDLDMAGEQTREAVFAQPDWLRRVPTDARLPDDGRVVTIGCGTSFHAAQTAGDAVQALEAVLAPLDADVLVCVSHEGETLLTLDVGGAINATELRVNGLVLGQGGDSSWTTSGTDAYRLSGNIGMGTTSAASTRLSVKGTTADSSASLLNLIDSNEASKFYVRNDGNIGVGTASPAYKVDVSGTLNATELRVNGVVVNPGTGSNWTVNGSDIYRGSGKIGIGTTTPGASASTSRSNFC